MIDVPALALAIARAAESEGKQTGRPGRLLDAGAVEVFLVALHGGRSLMAASVAAGFSEGVARRWLKLGTRPDASGVYADLARAVRAIRAACDASPVVDAPEQPTVRAAPVVPDPPASAVHEWLGLRAKAQASDDPHISRMFAQQLRVSMRSAGVEGMTLPDSWPRLNLPRGLSFAEVAGRYVAWCELAGEPPPNDYGVEQRAPVWYRSHVAPEAHHGSHVPQGS